MAVLVGDIRKASAYGQMAVDLTPGNNTGSIGWLKFIGAIYEECFEQFKEKEDLEKAIRYRQEVVNITPVNHPDRPDMLNSLGQVLLMSFEYFDKQQDLERAIICHQEAVDMVPDDHPTKALRVNALASSLVSRYTGFGSMADLDLAIQYYLNIVTITRDQSDKANYLHKLANAFQEAYDITPDGHPNKIIWLAGLGTAYQMRHIGFGDIKDLNEALKCSQQVLSMTPKDSSIRAYRLDALGAAFWACFVQQGEIAYLEQAIEYFQEAVDTTPQDHLRKSLWLSHMATALIKYTEILRNNGDYYNAGAVLTRALSALGSCMEAPVAPPKIYIEAAWQLGHLVSLMGQEYWQLSFEIFTKAMHKLPEAVWIGLGIQDQYFNIQKLGSLGHSAANAALRIDHHDTALEWLEQGRSLVWNHMLQLQTPLDALNKAHPALATRLAEIAGILYASKTDHGHSSVLGESNHYHNTALEWERVVKEIRETPGFESFLLPKNIKELYAVSYSGPIVTISISSSGCDALILVPAKQHVHHVALPDISYHEIMELQHRLHAILPSPAWKAQLKDTFCGHDPSCTCSCHKKGGHHVVNYKCGIVSSDLLRHFGRGNKKQTPLDIEKEMELILSTLWYQVVQPILKDLSIQPGSSEPLPHIIWCLTGPLMFLPIHATGDYTRSEPGHKLSDYCVSSYTPNIGVLLPDGGGNSDEFHMLAVGMSNAPVKEELENIKGLAGTLDVKILQDKDASLSEVISIVSKSNWVHFACHGLQDPQDPLSSALVLTGAKHLRLSDIIDSKFSGTSRGLAFLSACQTATGSTELADESVHLAAGMMFAGYKSVIATMWNIQDQYAPEVTAQVYKELFKSKKPDHKQSAYALHKAVEYLRKNHPTISYLSWVPYIHMGH
ncbi:hypothetical protein GLOTRDRAFT_93005 [Gloeophyllum trabeum ATCC 11539]|uniref:CHAT domain-containing protein n=1 Tax=Gloeophyllum trabeum (strain ATCC 11539 / FP-39264 / Madison 617) TaxID=670483 RepID=S7RTW9_GLOTA|nr:uncharacterized protein GLOTRDRAFT_93005 [Gloeophyllum trabeum ATCC 11539]EPQ56599.1 hypothetical protein GLOTRDRAFT_93005 [Gloeophyllum trabeum ATCC 11539]